MRKLFVGKRIFIFTLFIGLLNSLIGMAQDHQSKNNYKGNWEDAATWQIGNGNLSNNDYVDIYGYVVRNTDLTLNNNIVLDVYDTLVIYGNLTIGNNGYFNVHNNAMVVVYGNVISDNRVEIDLSSYFIVLGDFSQGNNSQVTAPSGDTLLFVTGQSSCGQNATCLPSDVVGGEDALLDNPDVGGFISGTSSQILPSNPLICGSSPVTLYIRNDGSSYQWYRNGTSIAGANSYTYQATSTGNYDVTFTVGGTNYILAGSPDPVTVTSVGVPVITSISATSPVEEGQTLSLSSNANPGTGTWPVTYSWQGPSSFTSYTQNANLSSVTTNMTGNYVLTVFNNEGCSANDTVYAEVLPAGSCCVGSQVVSKDNYTGNWEEASTWATPNETWRAIPPPTNPLYSFTTCINGYVTLNGDLTLDGGQMNICDTLVITGNLNLLNPTLTIGPNALLIVLGDLIGDQNGSNGVLNNGGRVVFAGDFTKNENRVFDGTGDVYIFDDTPYAPGYTYTGDETTLATNDPGLSDFVNVLTGGGVTCNVTASVSSTNITCNSGSDGSITISSPTGGSGVYEYTINGGTAWGSTGDFTGLSASSYDVRIRDANSTVCVDTLNAILILTEPAAITITLIPDTVCSGETATFNAGSGFNSYNWNVGGVAAGTAQTQDVTRIVNTGVTVDVPVQVTVTDNIGCNGTSNAVNATFYKLPVTGPGFHIDNKNNY